MFSVLSNVTYRHLFLAQLIALLGTGLATIALGLLAYQLAGDQAGVVLGTALSIKMIAYVGVTPIVTAFVNKFPRRQLLVFLDLIRMAVALSLPFVTEIWEIYVLIFFLQSASATFTPTFQATIPDVLPDEKDYTAALTLSRLAYDLENVISPMLAAALLTVLSFHNLFVGTAIGFVLSALFVLSVKLPNPNETKSRKVLDRMTRGARIYLATPRLRGLLALNLSVAGSVAMVLVNTVVIVQSMYGLSDRETAFAFAAFGGGSMVAAFGLSRLLDRFGERATMIGGAGLIMICTPLTALLPSYEMMLGLWFVIGFGFSVAQTPSGRLLARSANAEDRPAIYAAQFALSHLCWLLVYPLAGLVGAGYSMSFASFILMGVAVIGFLLTLILWPSTDPEVVNHDHEDLPADHPHLKEGRHHAHPYVIDDLHSTWPRA
jgi:MFS family permease